MSSWSEQPRRCAMGALATVMGSSVGVLGLSPSVAILRQYVLKSRVSTIVHPSNMPRGAIVGAGQRLAVTHTTRWRRGFSLTRIGGYQDIGGFDAAPNRAPPGQYAPDFMSPAGGNTAAEFGNRAARNLITAT
jgi:hypothetical protein